MGKGRAKVKKAIRKKISILRDAQKEKEVDESSLEIQELLFSVPEFRRAEVVMFYASLGREVRTESMIEKAIREGKQVALPRCDMKKGEILPCLIADYKQDLSPGVWGIMEPVGRSVISSQELDLVVAPGVAFDLFCNRVGRGKGFYDRFLKDVSPVTVKVGLAFDFQVIEKVPMSDEDVPMDKVVTESRVITR
jgi:5-formyltetrahydrofolate cyclo-ligase